MERLEVSNPKTFWKYVKYFCYVVILIHNVFYLLDVPIQNDYLRIGFGLLGLVAIMYLIYIGIVESNRR